MRNRPLSRVVIIFFVLAFMFLNLLTSRPLSASSSGLAFQTDTLKALCKCQEHPSWAAQYDPAIQPIVAPRLDPTILPVDVSLENNFPTCSIPPTGIGCQSCFDCFAWQLFIALNWPAATPGEPDRTAEFGRPDQFGPVVWETFKNVGDLFKDPNPDELPAWGAAEGSRVMTAVIQKNLRSTRQADHNWLTDQQGNMVWYEIRVNQDEYQYIRRNHLYNQDGIYHAFTAGEGIRLPNGPSQDGKYGAIEIKAAWRLVPKDKLNEYKTKYKISYAKNQPGGDTVPMALVGLHIIKKTPNSPQFVWATFEHKDNAPEKNNLSEVRQWSFYDREKPTGYTPNWANPPKGSIPKNTPVQVERIIPIGDEAKPINMAMHDAIAQLFPDSIWLNYVLVNVQWPAFPRQHVDATHTLPDGNPIPASVANTTMETYMQEKNMGGQGPGDAAHPNNGPSSCIGCHRRAAITPTFKKRINGGRSEWWWTDYSTIFYRAKAKDPAR